MDVYAPEYQELVANKAFHDVSRKDINLLATLLPLSHDEKQGRTHGNPVCWATVRRKPL